MSSMPRIPVIRTTSRPTASGAGRPGAITPQDAALNQSVKAQICALGRRWPLARVAEIVEANFAVKVSPAQIRAICTEPSVPEVEAAAAPEEHRADKESVHPADAPRDCLLTPPPEVPAHPSPTPPSPEPAPPFSIARDAAPTRTGPGQETDPVQPIAAAASPVPVVAPTRTGTGPDAGSHERLPTEVREFIIGQMANRHGPWLIAQEVLRKFDFEVDHDEIVVCWRDRDAQITLAEPDPEPGQQQAYRTKLSDAVKEFIVKRIACYETPSRIAAAVRINFGIDVDRRRIFDYNPKGTRPPARRWIDLHDATRARFLREVSEIGIAQKVIRLKMLDRFAEMAEDNHQHDKAARYLQQAARECGGFYERFQRPKAAAAGA